MNKKYLVFGIIGLFAFVSALWLGVSFIGNSNAVVIGENTEQMIITTDLTDFGTIDFSNPLTNLTQIKEFIIESPFGAEQTAYKVSIITTIEEAEPENCIIDEDEVIIELWKTGGYGYIGLITDGLQIQTAENIASGSSTYVFRLIAIDRQVCPASYDTEIIFTLV